MKERLWVKFHREEGERQGDGIKYKLKARGCEVRGKAPPSGFQTSQRPKLKVCVCVRERGGGEGEEEEGGGRKREVLWLEEFEEEGPVTESKLSTLNIKGLGKFCTFFKVNSSSISLPTTIALHRPNLLHGRISQPLHQMPEGLYTLCH